ncbi:MAG: efflux RND transporter permease subunit [Bryobacterales bacterium]|nr:efflux RND transporter permease subunit [Bryobacterales bacterium]
MHALAKLCVERPVFATMLILSLVVAGIFTYFSLGVDRFPNVDSPMVTVTVTNPGASPEEIETEITKKIEDAINPISQLDTLNSTSSEGMSMVSAQFELSKNADVAAQEVQNKINQVLNDLPSTAKTPVVSKMDPSATAVLQLAVSAPRSKRDVTRIADKLLKQRLENVAGVGEVSIIGGSAREIHVILEPDRLRAFNLTAADVSNALRVQNSEMPSGSLKSGAQDLTVRTIGKVSSVPEFGEIAIGSRGGYIVRVKDVATVEDSYAEPATLSLLDGEPSVQLSVAKQSGSNTSEVVDAVKSRLREIAPTLPKDVSVEIVNDQSVFVKASIDAIKEHMLEGSLLAALIIFVFLANWRTTLIAAIAIPTSIISTFAMMKVMGYTMNMITMLALTLMVGVVVDDAIIVLENIYRYMEEKGMGPFEAAIHGTREIGLAVLATTMSLLAVFIPVGFMGGMAGRFMGAFGLTCAFSVAISMLVSFSLTPMLCSRFVKPPAPGGSAHRSKDSAFFRFIDGHYSTMLRWAMAHRKTVVACCVLVVLSTVPLFMIIGKSFIPDDDQSQFTVNLRLPAGSSLAETTRYAEQTAAELRRMEGVKHILTTVGGGATSSASNSASLYVLLAPINERKLSQGELGSKARELLLASRPENVFVSVVTSSFGGGGGADMADVQYYLQGPDLKKLGEYADTILREAAKIPGLADIDSSLRSGTPEVRLAIDRERAADAGVSVQDIQQTLNMLVAGQTATTFNAGEDQYDVKVRAAERYRSTVEGLDQLNVPSNRLGSVPLSSVTRPVSGSGPSSIKRLGRQRIVNITGNLKSGGSQSEVLAALDGIIANLNLGSDYQGGASGMSKEMGKSMQQFAMAFALSFIFMYIVLAAQFESFIHPVTILLTLPLAVPFGILALLLTGQQMGLFSGLGVLLLFGIVKKNAILQIDHTNGLRAKGMPRYEAIIQANRDRLRPILMTTLALVFGMIPLMVSSGAGATTNRSIGVLVAGGQTLCLLLTLLAVPVFYSLWEDLGAWLSATSLGRRFGIPALNPASAVGAPQGEGL